MSAAPPSVRHLQDDATGVYADFDRRIAWRFWRFLTPYPRTLIGAAFSIAAVVASQLAIPLVIKHGIDDAVAGGKTPYVVLAVFLGAVAVNSIGAYLQELLAAGLAQRVIFDLRRAMFERLQRVSIGILDQTHVGKLMSRLQGDVNALQEFLESSISAVADIFLVIGIIVDLLILHWQLGLLTLIVLPALIIVRAIWLPRVRDTFRRAKDASAVVNAALAENINGVRTVIAARREARNLQQFEIKAAANRDAQIAAAWAAQIMAPIIDLLTGVAQATIVVGGGYAVVSGRIELGVMVAFIFYVQRFFDPIATLAQQYTVMQRAMAGASRIFEVLDAPVMNDAATYDGFDAAEPSVEFRHVTFGYRSGVPVLHDLNFRIEPRQTVALVGPTGSGKTSIAALIKRFHEVWSGEVVVAGRQVSSVSRAALGKKVAMVLQEPYLFSATIMQNIRYASDAVDEQVIAAAKAVRAHEFITRLQRGYDTELTQRGQNLSFGQRQLLSFARALVANPDILILDEATANIDSFTERDIQAALKVLQQGRTTLIIAHRLATIRHADMIVVLQAGRIVETGPHHVLVNAGGLYSRLYARSGVSFDDMDD